MTRDFQKQADTLEFWRLIELFTPQPVPQVTRGAGHDIVIEWNPKEALPWRSLPPAAENRVWQHTVYLGLYELSAVYETSSKAVQDDRDAHDLRPMGRSACAGLVVDEGGCLVAGSAVLSSCAWALGRLRRSPRRHDVWMAEFEQAKSSFAESIRAAEDRRSKLAGTQSAVSLGTRSLEELRRIVVSLTGLDRVPELSCASVLIRSRQVSPKVASELGEDDPLNSFHLEDLGTVRQAVREGDLGAGLQSYLTPADRVDEAHRVDVRRDGDAVTSGASAERISLGRWPSDPAHPLTLSQQLAVNEAVHGPTRSGGLLGIHGPPGTGKTTVLRELIAHNIVERARKLADLADPGDAFEAPEHDHRWKTDGYPRGVPRLKPEIAGFEMIVAAPQTTAVANVTAEISSASAIAERWRGNVDHFTNLASRILQDRAKSETPAGSSPSDQRDEAWALFCATLGDKTDRSQFMNSFWWGPRAEGEAADTAGFEQLLKAPNPPRRSWADCVAGFRGSLREAQTMQTERVEAERRCRLLPVLEAKLSEVRLHLAEASRSRDTLQQQLATHDEVAASLSAHGVILREAMQRQQAAQPGSWERLASFGRAMREWRPGFLACETALLENEQRIAETRRTGDALRSALSQARGRERILEADRARMDEHLARVRQQAAEDQAHYQEAYPRLESSGDTRELAAPWQDREFNLARSELFLAALGLHRAFIHDQAIKIRQGLFATHDVVTGQCPKNLGAQARLAAWQLFFLVVPVVSTTLASMPGMFRRLGAGSFGWMFIDEAGQCAPQDAVGGIWRAQRTIAVGDRLQLEPAVGIPFQVVSDIAASLKVSADWVPPRASVQTLADRVGRSAPPCTARPDRSAADRDRPGSPPGRAL